MNLTEFYATCSRLHDHERVERGDAAIAADVPVWVVSAAANCDLKCDHGVCGGKCMRFLGGRGAWNWLCLEWVELDFTPPYFLVIVDARIDRAVVHSGAPVVVLCFDGLVLGDVELPPLAVARCVVVAVLDDVVTDVVVCVAQADAVAVVVRHGATLQRVVARIIQVDATSVVRVRGVVSWKGSTHRFVSGPMQIKKLLFI